MKEERETIATDRSITSSASVERVKETPEDLVEFLGQACNPFASDTKYEVKVDGKTVATTSDRDEAMRELADHTGRK